MVITRYLFSPVHFSILIMDNENMFCWSLSTFGPLFCLTELFRCFPCVSLSIMSFLYLYSLMTFRINDVRPYLITDNEKTLLG